MTGGNGARRELRRFGERGESVHFLGPPFLVRRNGKGRILPRPLDIDAGLASPEAAAEEVGAEAVTRQEKGHFPKWELLLDNAAQSGNIMRVIARKALRDFWEREPGAEPELKAWFAEAEHAEWKNPADVKAKYGAASILQGGRAVFNICGNRYRLVVRIHYAFGVVYIRFIGRHDEYDRIDAATI